MLNDLSVFTEPWRKKQVYGFMGDPVKKWPADPTAYTLYFTDNGTGGRETFEGREGFWVRGGSDAEVIVRALDIRPIRQVWWTRGRSGGGSAHLSPGRRDDQRDPGPGGGGQATFSPPRGFPYYETFLYVLRWRSVLMRPARMGLSSL